MLIFRTSRPDRRHGSFTLAFDWGLDAVILLILFQRIWWWWRRLETFHATSWHSLTKICCAFPQEYTYTHTHVYILYTYIYIRYIERDISKPLAFEKASCSFHTCDAPLLCVITISTQSRCLETAGSRDECAPLSPSSSSSPTSSSSSSYFPSSFCFLFLFFSSPL